MLHFPLGEYSKSEVREMARHYGLSVADKADSQDICFVPNGRYTDVVARLAPEAITPGNIVHLDGRILGRHAGVAHYTVGQRRGLGLGASVTGRDAEPLFVVKIDAGKAEVVVGPHAALETRAVRLRDVNWIGDGELKDLPTQGLPVMARVRSTRPPLPARLFLDADMRVQVVFQTGEFGVSPGQACVFYDGEEEHARVLGGGFIAVAEMGDTLSSSFATTLTPQTNTSRASA
jgi:tRNA-specific 2-thiouridylase